MPPNDNAETRLRIARVTEADFDRLVTLAGGRRNSEDSSAKDAPNADYLLDDAIIELKLIEEEGLEKHERQRRLAGLFRGYQPKIPVVVLDPACLDAEGERRYFRIVAGPVQNSIKKASRQLECTRQGAGGDLARVLVAINNGYTALTHDEFTRVALKSAHNDTRNIDSVVVGGVYYYTDDFDFYALFPFEEYPINLSRRFVSFQRLKQRWDEFAEQIMTATLRGGTPDRFDKIPVVDIAFDIDGVTFVKPAPNMGTPSSFWGAERPRRNSTGLTSCPPVAMTFPDIDEQAWARLASTLGTSGFLKGSFPEWSRFGTCQQE